MLISSSICRHMDGQYFEDFIAEIYYLLGYDYQKTNYTGDQGLDLILYKESNNGTREKLGVQCKRYKNNVSNKAIQEAFSGSHYYECNKAIVITPSTFTKSAKELAHKLGVLLVDGHELDQILLSLQDYLLNNFFKHGKLTEILINTSIELARNYEIEKSIQILTHLKSYISLMNYNQAKSIFNNLGLSLSWNNEKMKAIKVYLEGLKFLENISTEDKFLIINNCLVAYRDCNLKEDALQFINKINIGELSPSSQETLKTRKQEILSII
ncbi:restriction endonuclease [Cytobacillus solani]|uniref:restriction endonuclease n=1 Tax=Cytobacillus solani TaxID=1637975 RepID=UPI000700A497|nr:restriction endonuclease [Cytobacillus solani]